MLGIVAVGIVVGTQVCGDDLRVVNSYDLEKLSTLYQEEVKSPKALDCKADPSGTTSKANTERAAYDKQARTFERALTKNEANQN